MSKPSSIPIEAMNYMRENSHLHSAREICKMFDLKYCSVKWYLESNNLTFKRRVMKAGKERSFCPITGYPVRD